MATKLPDYDFDQDQPVVERARKYPWDEWLDGSIWMLYSGQDFTNAPMMMERQIRNRASARGLSVRVRHENGHIVLRAEPKVSTSKEASKDAPEAPEKDPVEAPADEAPVKRRRVRRPVLA